MLLRAVLCGLLVLAGAAPSLAAACDNTPLFPPPTPLGVSGGNFNDTSDQYCCSGTLGCLVQDKKTGKQYILSNNHVLARTNLGEAGVDPIIQPGLADTACNPDSAQVVATLTQFVPLKFGSGTNRVDAAIAEVAPDQMDPTGAINCVGPVSSRLASAKVGLAVQKSGRTTGLTSGTVAAINVSFSISYNVTCGDDANKQEAKFKNQILITGNGFVDGGDSGSLVLNQDPCPRPVGLLFAGTIDRTWALANPIKKVLKAFKGKKLEVVGTCAPEPLATEAAPTTLTRLMDVQARHEDALLGVKGVVGMGIGVREDGKTPRLEIYVRKKTADVLKRLPKRLNSEAVHVVETGVMRAL